MPTKTTSSQDAAPAASGTQSVDRAAALVARVVRADGPLTFTELAEDTDFARSTTSRLLAALERADLLARDRGGAFVPGSLFEVYAAGRDDDEWLVEASGEVMASLGEATGETIHLSVARAGTVVQIAQVDSSYFLGSRDWIGVEVPAHTSALGKVFYAYGALPVPDGRLDQLTGLTIGSGADLARQLPGIRHQGCATTIDELEPGLTGIASPVFLHGDIVAAIGLSGPTSRLTENLAATGQVVARHARALSRTLGRHRKEGAA
ncbi:MAG TPA: IclR family transcriptional regulator [Phycicoccus sp.]|nr:IclR family transcriptional regulator [Phycicoccus sp.]HQK30153.1 IclR family transcriptional regulator [Phycicoccus sp.]HQY97570.1 IclR family transcriptional regulator [Phycicoccus sp.]HRA43569.1 IclR family transcriptional regulator [Phycicoccus sp.]